MWNAARLADLDVRKLTSIHQVIDRRSAYPKELRHVANSVQALSQYFQRRLTLDI
jgi:hypothetical protein